MVEWNRKKGRKREGREEERGKGETEERGK